MAKNIFTQTKEYVDKPKRNVFDLSFQNNLTMEFGKLYPVFCKEVIPGDSFKIHPTFGLRTLPLVFPVQTRMRANLHFFYVRNRNLWKNWTKFIGHTDSTVVAPYIKNPRFDTRSLGDYLGMPTELYGGLGSSSIMPMTSVGVYDSTGSICVASVNAGGDIYAGYAPYVKDLSGNFHELSTCNPSSLKGWHLVLNYKPSDRFYALMFPLFKVLTINMVSFTSGLNANVPKDSFAFVMGVDDNMNFVTDSPAFTCKVDSNNLIHLDIKDISASYTADILSSVKAWVLVYQVPECNLLTSYGLNRYKTTLGSYIPLAGNGDQKEIEYSKLPNKPFDKDIHVSALPFRAYESIYNAFYRNEMNDPLIVDGKPTYDVYVPNVDDGADSYPYELHYRNWEPDFLTSAVQSPQQGIAPLVGVSSSGDFTFTSKDSDGNVGYFTAKAEFGADGNSITGFKLSDKVMLKGVDTSTTGNMEHVPDSVKRGTIYTLNQMALAGISINDFRNVNSLQRWLETNIRRGYKYKEQLKSHFGVDVKYDELDMPEFIGGMSEPIYVNQVNNTSESDKQALGDYAGQASVMATADHSIEQYCDEHGFIIGILSISPVPNYSQLLPKMFLKNNYLDYFFPEFGHIGMQPIDYREVCPLQIANSGLNLNDTFGYQRAWYDYIASVDEVHGLFRTELRNFVCNRVFDSEPKLNHDFLKVDPNQLNDIFAVPDSADNNPSDKILGQIYFEVTAKRPIPRMGIPRLE